MGKSNYQLAGLNMIYLQEIDYLLTEVWCRDVALLRLYKHCYVSTRCELLEIALLSKRHNLTFWIIFAPIL